MTSEPDEPKPKPITTIYIDADACPVKEEIYRVARRYQVPVLVVSNSTMRVPAEAGIELVVVRGGFDAVDDWIVEHIQADDVAITADIQLADRLIRKQARVLGPKGDEFTDQAMGDALATRLLLEQLRQGGVIGGGPAPFSPRDRSRFLSNLDNLINAVKRGKKQPGR